MKKIKKFNLKAAFSTRSTKAGSYTAAACAVVIAIAIVFNLLVFAVPSAYTKLDMTDSGIFTLSEQTQQIVKSVDKDVTIYFIVQSGNEDSYVEELLNRYKELNDKIKIVKKDPVVYPNFAAEYTSESVSDNSLVVVCGDDYKYIAANDMYEYDEESYMYYQYGYTDSFDYSFDGENAVTSALDLLISGNAPVVYFVSGHSASELDTSFTSVLTNDNFKTEQLSLMSKNGVPEDADCLVIAGAETDLSKAECVVLADYLEKGGKLFVTTDYGVDTPNLNGVLSAYGVSLTDGLIFEGDTSKCVQYYSYLLPDVQTHDITSALKSSYVLVPNAQGIATAEDADEAITVSSLLSTSSSSVSKASGYNTDSMELEEGDSKGPFDVAVAITKTAEAKETEETTETAETTDTADDTTETAETTDTADDTTEKTDTQQTKIVYVSASSFIDSNLDYYVNSGNSDFFISCFGWLCGKESSISIHAKSITNATLSVSQGITNALSIFFIGIIPGISLIAGVTVFVRRKRSR